MTNMVSGSTQALSNTGGAVSGGGAAVTNQPLVAGDPAATTAAITAQPADPTMTSIVDAALAEQTATVTGGGAPGVSDPRGGIPEFVRRFLPAGEPQSQAAAGAMPGAPSKAPAQNVQQGWAWIGCCPQGPAQVPVDPAPEATPPTEPPIDELPPPPGKEDMPPPPGKEDMPPPPGKGELPPPPGKGEPPSKGEPPTAPPPGKTPPGKTPPGKTPPPPPTDKPDKVDKPKQRYTTYVVKPGDWLSKIAPKFGITWQQLYAANKDKIKDPDLIYPGQVLRVPLPDKPDKPNKPPKPDGPPPGKPTGPPTKPPGKPPVTEPPTKPPADKPTDKPPVDEPPSVDPPSGPPGTDPGRDGELPTAPPIPDTGGLPPVPPGF